MLNRNRGFTARIDCANLPLLDLLLTAWKAECYRSTHLQVHIPNSAFFHIVPVPFC